MGIKVEQEHTTDKYTALEITMDHLQEYPDYYTRLHEMEETAEAGGCRRGEKERGSISTRNEGSIPAAKKEGPSG